MLVAVTGSSGMIGSQLAAALRSAGDDVIRLVRRTPRTADEHRWDPGHRQLDPVVLAEVDAVVNLAGVGVGDFLWTRRHKQQVLASRVDSTATVSAALATAAVSDPSRPRVLLSGSAVGWYGDTGDRVVEEDAPPGTDFLAQLCVQWEGATEPAAAAGIRVATLRSGLVLGRSGLMGRLRPLFTLGLGGRLGSGQQYWPWISLRDEVDAIRFLLTSSVTGPVNLTAPRPVTNAEFTRTLGTVLHRPTLLAVPRPVLSAALGEFGRVAILAGQRAVPTKLRAAGFTWTHPDLEAALRVALNRP